MDEEAQWRADAVPHFAKPALCVPHIKANIDVGSFLVVEPRVHNGVDRLLCRLVKTEYLDATPTPTTTLVCNRFHVLRATGTGANLLSRHMDSVEQTAEMIHIDPASVIDIVFVFKQEDIDNLEYVAQGRQDSFVLLTPSPDTNGFFSFPCQSEYFNLSISLSRRIWRDMDTIRRCFRKILCSERMHQSTFAKRRDKVSFSDEAWAYLGRRIDGIAGVTSTGNDSVTVRADYEIGPAMRAIAKRRKLKCSSMSFNGEDGTRAFNALFGESSTLGIREKRPLLDKQERRVGVNDTLSYCSYIGLKFCEGTVYLYVHYRSYVYDTDPSSETGQPLDCPDSQLYRFLCRRSSAVQRLNLYPPNEESDEDSSGNNNNQHEYDADEARELLRDGARLRSGNRNYRVVRSLGEDEHSWVEVILIGDGADPRPELMMRNIALYLRKQYIN